MALHALNLLIARQLVSDVQRLHGEVGLHVVPPLCPLARSAYDFSGTDELIERATRSPRGAGSSGAGSKTAPSPASCSRTPTDGEGAKRSRQIPPRGIAREWSTGGPVRSLAVEIGQVGCEGRVIQPAFRIDEARENPVEVLVGKANAASLASAGSARGRIVCTLPPAEAWPAHSAESLGTSHRWPFAHG